MVKVYRKGSNVIITGHKPIPIDGWRYEKSEIDPSQIIIINEGDEKGEIEINWQKIRNEDGNGFSSEIELIAYLDGVFKQSKIPIYQDDVINGGIIM